MPGVAHPRRPPAHAATHWYVCASVITAVLCSVARNLRRVRRIAHLEPPAARIEARIDPPGAVTTGSEIRLAALGDSAVAGVGADRLDGCIAVQIAGRVARTRREAVHIRGHGVSGARTADVTRLQVRALDPADPPDAVIVVVGTNDVAHCTAPWRYARAVAHLHRTLRARVGVPVVYCSLPEFRAITIVDGPLRLLLIGYGRALGALQRRVLDGRPGAWRVDARRTAGAAFLTQRDAMCADGYHPSALGYGLLADALAPAVIAALAGTPAQCPPRRYVDAVVRSARAISDEDSVAPDAR